jgi:hypothetical protein
VYSVHSPAPCVCVDGGGGGQVSDRSSGEGTSSKQILPTCVNTKQAASSREGKE